MGFQEQSVKRKTMAVIMLTSVAVLLLTVAAFTLYDLATYRQNLAHSLSATAAIIADHSTRALAFRDEKDARATLASLRADPRIVAAALYDGRGSLFVRYPPQAPVSAFPLAPGKGGYQSEGGRVILFEPILESGRRLGTLYLRSSLHPLYRRLRMYGGIALLVLFGSVLVALAISNALQRQITRPILALAEVAKAVSDRGDYSIRAPKVRGDEIGLLTTAFNEMLGRIEEQTEALHQNEEMRSFLAAIVDSSDDAIIGKDFGSRVVSWNAGAEHMFGYTAAEMLGQPITRLQSPDRPEEEARILEEVKRGGIRHFETVRICKGGQPIEVSLTVSPIKNAHGDIIGISSIARDITERKRAERELRENRARLSGVIGSAMDAIISIDAGQRITIFNEAAEKMFVCPAREALGSSLERFIPARFREAHRGHVATFGRTGATSRAMGNLHPLSGRRTDGEEFPIEASISHIEVGGQQTYTVILRDITERKRAEEALRESERFIKSVAEASPHWFYVFDFDSQGITYANRPILRDLGYPPDVHNTVTALDAFRAFMPPEELPHLARLIEEWQTLPDGLVRDDEYRLRCADGSLHYFAGREIVFARRSDGTVQRILGSLSDITERKRAEEQILRLNAELEQRVQERTAELSVANKELEAFTYSVAHDLRAPLRHIDAFSKILEEDCAGVLPLEAVHYLQNIRNSTGKMSLLVDDLLNLARVGRQELRRQTTPLRGLVDEVVADLKAETAGRTLEWHIETLPAIECDPGLMKQVFANLLSNAVKYTRPRPVAVIEVGYRKKNGDSAVFVRDNGVGFNMKYADKLFGVFQRFHRAEEFEGTGVGLATVDRIVRKHGGHIWAEAAVDKGATFYFTVAGLEPASVPEQEHMAL